MSRSRLAPAAASRAACCRALRQEDPTRSRSSSRIGRAVGKIFAPLGYTNIESRVGDGYFGWPEVKDGFDVIIVTCAAQYAPPELFKQLKPGGRMLIPIGQPFKRGQILYVYSKDEDGKVRSRKDVGVFFIPMTGAMMNRPHPTGAATPAAPASAAGAETTSE